MRNPLPAFAVVFALGVLLLLSLGLAEHRSTAFTLGVVPDKSLFVKPDSVICQGPIEVAERFSAVRLTIAAPIVSSDPAKVDVQDAPSRRRLTGGILHGGYPSAKTTAIVPVAPVRSGARIRVCIRTSRRGGLLVFGNLSPAVRGSAASIDGRPRNFDVDVAFLREHRTSVVGMLGEIVRRASLFHGGWVKPWTLWAVALLMLTAFPAGLGLALARVRDEADDQPSASASE